jgi:hypothetical protein
MIILIFLFLIFGVRFLLLWPALFSTLYNRPGLLSYYYDVLYIVSIGRPFYLFLPESLILRIGICFRSPVATHLFIFLAGPRASENKMLSCRSSGFILAGIYIRWTVCLCVSVYIYTASSPSQGLMCAVISEIKGTKEKLEDEVE